MPLPAALAARLAKRGILPKPKRPEVEEEVFAENYDDQEDDSKYKSSSHFDDGIRGGLTRDDKTNFMGYPGCPNKWNVYHECAVFCQHHWGSGRPESNLDPEYAAKRARMLAKYASPLPEGWKEIYDPGTGRHFYWCTRTDRVSWLPPGHPKAEVTEAASQVREMLQGQLHINENEDDLDDDDEEEEEDEDQAMDLDSDMESDDEEEDRRLELQRRKEKEKRREEQDKYRGGSHASRAKSNKKDDDGDRLDPMDPAAYSDVPRGSWTSGLTDESTKTGVDSTASGQLFQMRPYPSPGAILRANASKKK